MRPAHRTPATLPLLLLLLAPLPAAAELDCESLGNLTTEFVRHHVIHNNTGQEVEARAIDAYLRRLDTSRSLLLESEVEGLRSSLVGVLDHLRKKSTCASISNAHQAVIARQLLAEAYVTGMLADPELAIDESVELQLDPDDRGYPKTPEEREELWRRLVHFQLSNYLGAGEDMAEAKRLLTERYARHTRRLSGLSAVDVLSSFLDSFASALDPHSNYFTPQAVEDFRISMSLSLEGIGVALTERDGYSVVERIIPGGAADRLGDALKPKDKIIAVAEDGREPESIIDMPLREAVSLIRGKAGTKVHLTVLRQAEETSRFPVAIVRDKIDLSEQAASLRFEERMRDGKPFKLAVLELPSFYGDANPEERQSTDDVERLLSEANQAGADGLLLDLSRNGGGLLEHAVEISGYFIRRGEIVGVRSTRTDMHILTDRDERILYTGPMVVHVSRISASASEILAGALKDYGRAVITGDDHTFGKGTVQTVQPLTEDLGALKITTALFFRPGGLSTQKDGVAADVVIPSLLASDDFGERHQRYALESGRIPPFFSSRANAFPLEDRASRVADGVVAELQRRSAARVAGNTEFQEVRDQLQETEATSGIVRVADILKRQEEARGELEEDEAAEDENELDLQVKEAVEILADLVALTRSAEPTKTPQAQANNL